MSEAMTSLTICKNDWIKKKEPQRASFLLEPNIEELVEFYVLKYSVGFWIYAIIALIDQSIDI